MLLLRNFALAVIPAVTDLATELFASAAVVMACVLLGVSMSPWIVRHANHLDVAMHTGLLFVLILAALQTNVDDEVVGRLLLAVFSCITCAFLIAMGWSLHLCALRLRKPFQFFLCHHKVGGGAFCRLLKVRLLSHGQVSSDVFLDSDNLQDLSLLFAIVGEKTETLVVLCTKEILYRPWCVGEMTTARLHNVDTILVIFPDFDDPTRILHRQLRKRGGSPVPGSLRHQPRDGATDTVVAWHSALDSAPPFHKFDGHRCSCGKVGQQKEGKTGDGDRVVRDVHNQDT